MQKEKMPLAVLVVVGVMLIVVGSSPAKAGDDPVTVLPMSLDAGSDVNCTPVGLLKINQQYAVQPSVNAYVGTSSVNDGGLTTDGGAGASSRNVLVEANKLYDIYPTVDKPYICCKPTADGQASTCRILRYREL